MMEKMSRMMLGRDDGDRQRGGRREKDKSNCLICHPFLSRPEDTVQHNKHCKEGQASCGCTADIFPIWPVI